MWSSISSRLFAVFALTYTKDVAGSWPGAAKYGEGTILDSSLSNLGPGVCLNLQWTYDVVSDSVHKACPLC